MNTKHLAASVLASLACAAVHAGNPELLSDREMSAVYGQGLSAPVVSALASGGTVSAGAAVADVHALEGFLATAATLEGERGLDRRFAEQQLNTATLGLQVELSVARTVAASTAFSASTALVLPSLAMPLGMLMGLPVGLAGLPVNTKTDNNKPGH